MKKILLIILGLFILLYIAGLLISVDPNEQRPGTQLSGELVSQTPVDWSFVQPRQKVWVQTSTWYGIPHSVTTVSFVIDDHLYIPCGWCATKRWPKNVSANPNVIVKVGEKLYPRRAVEVTDQEFIDAVFGQMDIDTSSVALYRMDPQS
ncbi:MAG: hypothetical protein AAF541_15045 [Pseudomonadota bacterium]